MASKLEIIIAGDTKQLEAALNRATRSTSVFQKGLNSASVFAGGALAALGIGGKIAFDEFAEGERVAAQTGAVIKSTGGAAKVTAGQVQDLANSLSAKSGVDDEAIASGQNLLLTFTKVRNEAGKGNDIFNQGTKAALDMSVAMGKDLNSSTLLVGKALNDPIKGVTALSRAGIQFTDQQKKQIKAMVESGDVMGAQKIILQELETQFGGSAEAAGDTFTGKLNKAKNAAVNFAGELFSGLVPTLDAVAGMFMEVTGWMQKHQTVTKVAIGVVAGLSAGILALNAAIRVAAAVSKIWAAAQVVLNAVMVANPFVLAAAAVVGLGVAFAVAWRKSETFRNVVTGTWDAIKTAAKTVFGWVAPYVKDTFNGIVTAARGFFQVIQGIWNMFAGVFTGDWRRVWDGIKGIVTGVVRAIPGMIRAFLGPVGNAALDLGKAVVTRIGAGLAGLLGKVHDFVSDIPGKIRSFLSAVGSAAVDLGSRVVSGIGTGLASLGGKLVGWIKTPVNAMISAVNNVIRRINSTVSFSIDMPGPIPDISVNPPDIKTIPMLATGGRIMETGVAVVHKGESVIPAHHKAGGGDVHLTVNGWVGDEQALVERIRAELIRGGRRMPGVLGGLA